MSSLLEVYGTIICICLVFLFDWFDEPYTDGGGGRRPAASAKAAMTFSLESFNGFCVATDPQILSSFTGGREEEGG